MQQKKNIIEIECIYTPAVHTQTHTTKNLLMFLPRNIAHTLLLLLVLFVSTSTTYSLTTKQNIPIFGQKNIQRPNNIITKMNKISDDCDRSKLPGDPSLVLQTNVDLGNEKMNIMKACSKAVASCLGKPESYVGKSIHIIIFIFNIDTKISLFRTILFLIIFHWE